MNTTETPVRTTLRVPGNWSSPKELLDRIPDDCRLTADALVLPDGTEIEISPMPPDGQFAQIFESSCRNPATDDETTVVNNYTVNIGLTGPGGSMEAALLMMQAGAAVVRAGGAGVFIDNSALAHGGGDWVQMTDDGSPDALSFAFVSVVRGEGEIYTVGMHVMGWPDLVMRRTDLDADAETIIEVVRYICEGENPVGDGHIIAGLDGPRYVAQTTDGDEMTADSPMHNPFGRLKLVSMKDVADSN